MIPFSHLISDSGVVTVFVGGKPYTFAQDNPHYDKVKKAIEEKNSDEIVRLGTLPKRIEQYADNLIKVENGVVSYKGRQIHNSLTRRIIKLMAEGFPFASMLKFLENLMQNPFSHSVSELYNFLVNRNLPITENGCFLAYKSVDANYMDWHTHSVRNMVGDTPPRMEWNEVDQDWRNECSSGYHVGAIEYVTGFHQEGGHIMIVEVNPADVVSCPASDTFTKCRCCGYTVVGEMDGELLAQVYKTSQTSYTPAAPATAVAPVGTMSNVPDDRCPAQEDEEEDEEDFDEDEDEDEDEDNEY